MLKGFFACGVSLAMASAASAGLLVETESNNTPGTANFLTAFSPPGGSIAVDGVKDVGDVDWYRFDLTAMSTVVLTTIGSSESPEPDTQLQLVAGDGTTILDWDDDDGPGFLSALNVVGLPAGTYYIGVSSFADATSTNGLTMLFDGIDTITGQPTVDVFTYKLSIAVNLVPAPGSAALLGLGGLVALRRRR